MTDQKTTDDPVLALVRQLGNAASRSVLWAATTTPQSIAELTEASDCPSSTVYRKVHRLEELGLLEEQVRLRPEGQNVSEYRLGPRRVAVTFDLAADPGLDWRLEVSRRPGRSSGGSADRPAVWTDGGASPGPVGGTRQTRLDEFD